MHSCIFQRGKAEMVAPMSVAIWAFTSIVTAVAGPFGGYGTVPLPTRLLFWGLVIGVSMLLAAVLRGLLIDVLRLPRNGLSDALAAVLLAVLVTPLIHLLAHAIFGDGHSPIPHGVETGFLVFFIALSLGLFRSMVAPPPMRGFLDATMAEAAGGGLTGADAGPRLLSRLDPQVRGDLIRISVRDHYVDVVTSRGQGSLLLRFSDAMAETDGVEGFQVHRSHWVARGAVQGVERAGGRLILRLRDGSAVPVSRNHREKLAERGLI